MPESLASAGRSHFRCTYCAHTAAQEFFKYHPSVRSPTCVRGPAATATSRSIRRVAPFRHRTRNRVLRRTARTSRRRQHNSPRQSACSPTNMRGGTCAAQFFGFWRSGQRHGISAGGSQMPEAYGIRPSWLTNRSKPANLSFSSSSGGSTLDPMDWSSFFHFRSKLSYLREL
jgi:hypothetical protein